MRAINQCLVVLALASTALPTLAQDGGGKLNQRFWGQIGAFHPSIDSDARADHPDTGAPGTALDLEDALGLPKHKNVPTLLLGARLNDRWRAEFEYFKLKRSGTETISVPITFDDTTYIASASIASEFESTVYRLGGGYSFYKTPNAEAGVVVGLHVTDFRIALTGSGSIDGGTVAVRSERKSQAVPLPTLGAYASYAFANNWEATGRVDWLALKVGDYKGRLLNLQASLFYRFSPNLAAGLGYRYDDYKVNIDRSDLSGEVHYRFSGPQLILDAGF